MGAPPQMVHGGAPVRRRRETECMNRDSVHSRRDANQLAGTVHCHDRDVTQATTATSPKPRPRHHNYLFISLNARCTQSTLRSKTMSGVTPTLSMVLCFAVKYRPVVNFNADPSSNS